MHDSLQDKNSHLPIHFLENRALFWARPDSFLGACVQEHTHLALGRERGREGEGESGREKERETEGESKRHR